ncbi:unnamed protein product [Ambrosiozyma monospora]|uniref:Lysophospholipase n=1 Tax=Ambrosiozyma monospora TaxID=43982 RepID=A0A9W7DGP4_AMBMO|nr:unnamed protein product [Ambrosiozyma monospora]
MLIQTTFALILSLAVSQVSADYTPKHTTCPANATFALTNEEHSGILRGNSHIAEAEYDWIQERDAKAKTSLVKFLNHLNMSDYPHGFDNYFNDSTSFSKIGLGFSGGSYRALLTGAGEFQALDSRSGSDGLSGLLDSSSYIASVSGGSMMLASLIFQNWSSVDDIISTNELWNMTSFPISADVKQLEGLVAEVSSRKSAGFEITLTDVFSRVISRVMFTNIDEYGLNLQWSDIQKLDAYINHEMPFPILESTGGASTNLSEYFDNEFEITPYELGSWSPKAAGFLDLEYLGTGLDTGNPANSSACVTNFDNAGLMVAYSADFISGFSSALESGDMSQLSGLGLNVSSSLISFFLKSINPDTSEVLLGVLPNPYDDDSMSEDDAPLNDSDVLRLTDSGTIGETLPLDALLAPSREVDIIFAFDNSANTEDNWPNGTSLYTTRSRILKNSENATFYDLPESPEEFIKGGYGKTTTFFGCNGSSLLTETDDFSVMKPLLVYVPNRNVTTMSNTTSFVFTDDERDDMIDNGYEIPTALLDEDPEFLQCIGCAILRRSQERSQAEIGDQCLKCFQQYCYDGFDNAGVESKPKEVFGTSAFTYSESPSTSTESGSVSATKSAGDATSTSKSHSANDAMGYNYGKPSFLSWLIGCLVLVIL